MNMNMNMNMNMILDINTLFFFLFFIFIYRGANLNQPGGDGLTPIFRAVGPEAEKRGLYIYIDI